MYKNILVITDNTIQSERFEKLLLRKELNSVKWNFSVSSFSNIDDFKFTITNEVKRYDLKKAEDINEIINTYDLVFSLHCKQIFPKSLIKAVKCINVHPGYNPINRGWYPHIFSIIYDLPIGATIHEIDEHLDHGPIVDRELVKKFTFDTGETLYNRILKKEIELLERNIKNIINGDYKTFEPESNGNLFLKKDFEDLKEIDLNEHTTILKLIDRFRALAHSNYNNAYFIDPKTKKKIFVSLKLELEKGNQNIDKKT